MLILKVTDPDGREYHVAAAFPSACGKTNLAMLRPTIPGWKVETVGDDIAWLRPGDGRPALRDQPRGRLLRRRARHRRVDQRHAVETLWGNTIFTNVALRRRRRRVVGGPDRRARRPTSSTGRATTGRRPPGVPPRTRTRRFTVAAAQCPSIADDWEDPAGVPIDAILFGGRRATQRAAGQPRPTDWEHGVFMGATVSSEQTAAAEGTVGELRRDPFAMLPFCGYNMADYWAHWLEVGRARWATSAPRIFQVNWFRKDADGRFLWPGFGDNSRRDRVDDPPRSTARSARWTRSSGRLPAPGDLNLDGLDVIGRSSSPSCSRSTPTRGSRGRPHRGVLRPVRRQGSRGPAPAALVPARADRQGPGRGRVGTSTALTTHSPHKL